MPLLPTLTTEYSEQEITDVFGGYNHNLKIGDGEMFDMLNLSSDEFPLLSQRKKRGYVRELTAPMGLAAKTQLAWVDNGTLWYGGEETDVTELEESEKQLVSMGGYLCIFPDKKWYNTADGSSGSMEAYYASSGNVRYAMCRMDGTEYDTATVSDTPPTEPENSALWIDTSKDAHVLKQWAEAQQEWVSIPTVYTKITFNTRGLIRKFREQDAVTISGSEARELNGDRIIKGIGGDGQTDDYIIVVGLIERTMTQKTGSVHISREVPEMDFVCEAQNRLWGCRYGDGLNEIYACALGDFNNWRRYEGISTDSWAASVGSDGEWTGCINYLGYPTFFKEERIYRIAVSTSGAHSLSETVARGVQKGSEKSLCVVNETLVYKSRNDVCIYQGGFPTGISEALGKEDYQDAAAGTVRDKYYLSMLDSKGETVLFVYDIRNGLWIKEDGLRCEYFARMGDELYCISGKRLIALLGSEGTEEPYVQWMAESGMLYYKAPERKYVSRFNVRVQMEKDAEIEIYIRYDEEEKWQFKGKLTSSTCRTVPIPIRPKRCDHLRIRLTGKGEFKLYSIARNLSYGSDV